MSLTPDHDDAEMAALYARSYRRLVGILGAVAQDQHEAEEAVQDAFVRLIGQWRRVSAYEDPEAWVRMVAFGNLSKRRRSRLRGLKAAARLPTTDHVAEPSGETVDFERAFTQLPKAHREVLVLQQLGLSTAEAAAALQVSPGTIKSRLSRARASLAPWMAEEPMNHV